MKDIITEILNNINLSTSVKVYFINPNYNRSQKNDYMIAKLNINDSAVKAIKSVIRSCASELVDKQQITIHNIEKEDDDYVITIPCTEVDGLNEYIKLILEENYTNFNSNDSKSSLEKLKYYIVQIRINKKEYYFIKRYSFNKLMAPKKQLMFLLKQEVFQHINSKNLFVLSNSIDAFIRDNLVYVINEKQFSLMTGYYEKERAKASDILDKFNETGLIANFNKLIEYCNSKISYMKRLSKVDINSLPSITFEKVLELKEKRGTDISMDKRRKKLSFQNNEQLKNIIDLLLDNFVTSDVTSEPYRALNKYKDNKPA